MPISNIHHTTRGPWRNVSQLALLTHSHATFFSVSAACSCCCCWFWCCFSSCALKWKLQRKSGHGKKRNFLQSSRKVQPCKIGVIQPGWLSLSLSLPFSARTLTGLPLSLHFHSIVVAPSLSLADTDSGSLGIAKGALFSFGELFRSLGFYCLGNYLPQSQKVGFKLHAQSCHDNQPIFQSPDWVLRKPGPENTSKISNFSPEAQWVSVQLFCQIKNQQRVGGGGSYRR